MARPTIGTTVVSQTATSATHTATLPSHSTGDLLVVVGYVTRADTTMTINEGYTALFAAQGITDTRSLTFRAFAKVAGASESAPVITSGDAGGSQVAFVTNFENATATVGDIETSTAIASDPGNDPTWASMTVSNDESVAFRYAFASDDNQAVSEPAVPAGHTSIGFGEDSGGLLGFGVLSVDADPTTLAAATWIGMWGQFAVDEVEGLVTIVIPPAAVSLTYEQEGFRFRNDDGSESAASWRQTQDVDDSVGKEVNVRLRVLTDTTGDSPSVTRTLQVRRDDEATTEWRDV